MTEEHELIPPLEMTVRGTPEMVEAIVIGVAYDMRVPIELDDATPQLRFFRQLGMAPKAQRAGFVRLQAIPNDRTLVTLWVDQADDETDVAIFSAFTTALAKQLARLDFVDAAGIPKAPLGFRRLERPQRPDPKP